MIGRKGPADMLSASFVWTVTQRSQSHDHAAGIAFSGLGLYAVVGQDELQGMEMKQGEIKLLYANSGIRH